MKESIKELILYYKAYLNKKNKDNDIYINNQSSKNIENLVIKTKKELKTLKNLSEKYKLYDENYNEFMISMGKLALSIEMHEKYEGNLKLIIKDFENMHNDFEILEQINIMKDVYTWKFVSSKKKK